LCRRLRTGTIFRQQILALVAINGNYWVGNGFRKTPILI
jgi:hypothetical protein